MLAPVSGPARKASIPTVAPTHAAMVNREGDRCTIQRMLAIRAAVATSIPKPSQGNRRFKSSWRSSCHHPGTEEAAKELSSEVHGEKVGIKLTISPKGKANGGVDVGSTPRSKDKNGEHDDRTKRKRNDAVACPHRNATATHADHQRRAEKFPSRLSPHKLARANGLKAFVKKVMNRSYPRQASRSGCFSFGHG